MPQALPTIYSGPGPNADRRGRDSYLENVQHVFVAEQGHGDADLLILRLVASWGYLGAQRRQICWLTKAHPGWGRQPTPPDGMAHRASPLSEGGEDSLVCAEYSGARQHGRGTCQEGGLQAQHDPLGKEKLALHSNLGVRSLFTLLGAWRRGRHMGPCHLLLRRHLQRFASRPCIPRPTGLLWDKPTPR